MQASLTRGTRVYTTVSTIEDMSAYAGMIICYGILDDKIRDLRKKIYAYVSDRTNIGISYQLYDFQKVNEKTYNVLFRNGEKPISLCLASTKEIRTLRKSLENKELCLEIDPDYIPRLNAILNKEALPPLAIDVFSRRLQIFSKIQDIELIFGRFVIYKTSMREFTNNGCFITSAPGFCGFIDYESTGLLGETYGYKLFRLVKPRDNSDFCMLDTDTIKNISMRLALPEEIDEIARMVLADTAKFPQVKNKATQMKLEFTLDWFLVRDHGSVNTQLSEKLD